MIDVVHTDKNMQ